MLMMAQGKFHPWLALTLAILAGAATLVLVLRESGDEGAPSQSAKSEARKPVPAPAAPTHDDASAGAAPAAISPEELEKFRRHLLGATLHEYGLEWMDAATGRELFLAGRIRDAMAQAERELARRIAGGDRDAAARLIGMREGCDDPELLDTQQDLNERAPQTRQRLLAVANRLSPAARAKALVAVDVEAKQAELVSSFCEGPSPVDVDDLEEKVRQAASDGHTLSLQVMASIAARKRDEAGRERYLLSASLLGASEAQWRLAGLYRERLTADPNSKDRGKMRFWLEQAFDKIPAAAFDLGDCLRSECDGQPANPERAQRLIESAASQGESRAIEAMIEGAGASDKFSQYAWLDFRARLAEEGCATAAIVTIHASDERDRTRNAFYPDERGEADRRGKELYDRFGAGARAALGCD